MKFLKNKLIIILILLSFGEISAKDSVNRIYGIIGKYSITQLDYEKGEDRYKKLFKKGNPPYKGSMKTQVMNFLIERMIIDITCEEESIQVNDKRVEAEVDRIMENSGFKDRALFEKNLSDKTGLPFDIWLAELPYQIKKGQLMQVRVPPKTPTEAEINDWYAKNINRIGFELKYREIILLPKNSSTDEELRVSNELNQILKEVKKDKSAFALIASGPRNASSIRGGFHDWVSVTEIMQKNRPLVNQLGILEVNGVSNVFRDERDRYCIVKLEGKRPTPKENVRRAIQEILGREKMDTSFHDWVMERRKEVPMLIYDEEYVKENKIEAPDETFNIDKVKDK
ncbi:MAG: putative peptidyl-prolyl cis-trans isomerase [Leptospiraceae bacterium]|nr:putative peptidyl-prolyl cis-trans isomerase [Leptospiraceae bacterium]